MGDSLKLEHLLRGSNDTKYSLLSIRGQSPRNGGTGIAGYHNFHIYPVRAQASIDYIMFTCIRYELSLGQGLPFGALFSGLQVSQVSYLWSMEFWGTACSTNLLIRKKISIIGVISIAIFLAATIGPSSAILLIPRLAYWPAGSTDIWVNTIFQDLWPDRSVFGDTLILEPCDY